VGELRDEPAPQTGQRHGIVVLGHELNEDGTIRPELAERLEVVARLWRSEPDDDVIVSGGMVRGGAVEAPLMRAWLIRAGVDGDRIILEPHSFDTLENATLSTRVAVRAGIHSLTLVTSDYHMARASALFEATRELMAGRHHRPPRVVRRRSARRPAETTTGERSAVRDIAAERDLLRLGGIWTIPGYFR
jgi:vancomycin permeability regulator SanA